MTTGFHQVQIDRNSSEPTDDRRTLLSIALPALIWLVAFAVIAGLLHFTRTHARLTDLLWPITLVFSVLASLVLPRGWTEDPSGALQTLTKGLAITCFIYLALQLPGFTFDDSGSIWSPTLVTVTWAIALLASVLAWRYPSLLLIPAVWLPWVKSLAGHLTGFEYSRTLDILPLFQLALGAALAATTISVLLGVSGIRNTLSPRLLRARTSWAEIAVFVLVCFHLSSYVMSGMAKVMLDGGPLTWMLENEIRNIFFAGVVLEHLVWQDISGAVSATTQFFELAGRPMSIAILLIQLAAVTAFVSKRWALFLLLAYDGLHVGIFLTQGANFFSWVLVNLCLVAALAKLPNRYFGLRPMCMGIVLMLFCAFAYGKFYRVAALGWYDTLAVNAVHIVAETADGRERHVPNAFFGFYSYPMSHMSFGYPEPGRYLPTGTNGGTDISRIERLARDCSFSESDWASTKGERWDPEGLSNLVRNRHAQLLAKDPGPLSWMANVYWHHFWNPPSVFARFREIRLDEIESFRLVVNSYCLQPTASGPARKQVSSNEFSIPLSTTETPDG